MSDDPEAPIAAAEEAITTVVSANPVLFHPELDDPNLLEAFINDVAQDIEEKRVVAARYGFTLTEMRDYLIRHKKVLQRVKERAAVWNSDAGVPSQLRTYAGVILRDALPEMGRRLHNPSTPANVKLDTEKLLARMAGVDGLPAPDKAAGPAGNAFVVNFNFGDDKKKMTISATPVVESDA